MLKHLVIAVISHIDIQIWLIEDWSQIWKSVENTLIYVFESLHML